MPRLTGERLARRAVSDQEDGVDGGPLRIHGRAQGAGGQGQAVADAGGAVDHGDGAIL